MHGLRVLLGGLHLRGGPRGLCTTSLAQAGHTVHTSQTVVNYHLMARDSWPRTLTIFSVVFTSSPAPNAH